MVDGILFLIADATPFVHDVPSANGSRSDEEENPMESALNVNVKEILLNASLERVKKVLLSGDYRQAL